MKNQLHSLSLCSLGICRLKQICYIELVKSTLSQDSYFALSSIIRKRVGIHMLRTEMAKSKKDRVMKRTLATGRHFVREAVPRTFLTCNRRKEKASFKTGCSCPVADGGLWMEVTHMHAGIDRPKEGVRK